MLDTTLRLKLETTSHAPYNPTVKTNMQGGERLISKVQKQKKRHKPIPTCLQVTFRLFIQSLTGLTRVMIELISEEDLTERTLGYSMMFAFN